MVLACGLVGKGFGGAKWEWFGGNGGVGQVLGSKETGAGCGARRWCLWLLRSRELSREDIMHGLHMGEAWHLFQYSPLERTGCEHWVRSSIFCTLYLCQAHGHFMNVNE